MGALLGRSEAASPVPSSSWSAPTIHEWQQRVEPEREFTSAAQRLRYYDQVYNRVKFLDHRLFDAASEHASNRLVPSFSDPRDLRGYMRRHGSTDAVTRFSEDERPGTDILTTTGTFEKDGFEVEVEQKDTYIQPEQTRRLGQVYPGPDTMKSDLTVWWKRIPRPGGTDRNPVQSSRTDWREHCIVEHPDPLRSTHHFHFSWEEEGKHLGFASTYTSGKGKGFEETERRSPHGRWHTRGNRE